MKSGITALLLACSLLPAMAQAPGVPIEEPGAATGSADILEKAGRLREAGKLVGAARFRELLEKPSPENITLQPAKTGLLSPAAIYEHARQARVRVGWYYLCHKCNHWHTRLAGGYPLTADGVIATCHHVAKPGDDMREGYLIVVDADGQVTPVTSVIAGNAGRDICLLRAGGGTFHAMTLNETVRPGDAAFCLSDPLGINGYFSSGMVNRFYRKPDGTGPPEDRLRLHVSTDWAPGSSGSPVLDQAGNVIGHVSTISPMTGTADSPNPANRADTQIVLHEACPARSILSLLQPAGPAPEAPAAPKP